MSRATLTVGSTAQHSLQQYGVKSMDFSTGAPIGTADYDHSFRPGATCMNSASERA